MCGINGIYGLEKIDDPKRMMNKMNQTMAHRGPDADGIFHQNNVILGHRRLSIIDLSMESNQPFYSDDNRFVIVYNGEIYNYNELKGELSEFNFKTKSDTEVLLNAYRKWGRNFLSRLEGMFAFAIWDNQSSELFIARDRLGIKPLYFYRNDHSFIFSSELRSLLSSDLIPRKINHDALIDYLRYQTVHAPNTIIENVQMLMPGHYFVINDNEVKVEQYWSLGRNVNYSSSKQSYDEIKSKTFQLLSLAVKKRLNADVPFGSFLSGGIDSSAVVAMMSLNSSKAVRTFCISFDDSEFSEAKYAKIIAEKYNTDHTEINLNPNDFLNLLPDAINAMDHPSGDGPNTYVVSKVTKEAGVSMALSGLGGDELFAGYEVFNRMYNLKSKEWLQYFPKGLRAIGSNIYSTIKPSVSADKLSEFLRLQYYHIENVYPINRKVLTEKAISKLVDFKKLPSNSVFKIANELIGVGGDTQNFHDLSKVSVLEISTYMQNTLLRDTDQMSMAHALEVRVPFLDHHLVEYVLGVNDTIKMPTSPKKLLVESLGDLLPQEIVNRPKMGFTFPWEKWMKNELKDFCFQKISSLSKRKFMNEKEVISLWERFNNGDKRITWSRVWYLIVLENWLQLNRIED